VDRSSNANSHSMALSDSNRIVHSSLTFHFVGANRREVLFTTSAASLEDAWTRFRATPHANSEIIFVIKTQTEIYLVT
jgi:hypothetical protein